MNPSNGGESFRSSSSSSPASDSGGHRQRLPQTIAHRGFRAEYPENTMSAFEAAVAVGAHALETDVHLSRDGVVVLSHDPSLLRCFGQKQKIADCDWEYLSTLRTLREPASPMPRLVDLLEYLAQPAQEGIWVLLDIKRDDSADKLMAKIAETVASVPPASSRPWTERIVLGCWDAKYMKLSTVHLPAFPVAFIGFSLMRARSFLPLPNVSFNMRQSVLVGPCGARFRADVRAAGRLLWTWTVNELGWMEWCIRAGLDGVVTDDPRLFVEVCRRWGGRGARDLSVSDTAVPAVLQQQQRERKAVTMMAASTAPRSTGWRWVQNYAQVVFEHALFTVMDVNFWLRHGSWARAVRRDLES